MNLQELLLMSLKHNVLKIFLLLAVLFLGAFGFFVLGISFLSCELVKPSIDALAPDGKSEQFNCALFEQIVIRARLIGIVLIVLSGVLYGLRKKVWEYTRAVLNAFSHLLPGLTKQFSEAVRKEEKMHLYALFIILITAFVVRLFFLFQPIRYDEAFTFINFASKPLYRGLSDYSYPNNHLFHTLLVHISHLMFGNQPWILRLPVFCAGILTVAASYIVMRIFFDKYTALLTAGFVASSPVLILYSTNARGYMVLCLIFLMLCALATYLIQTGDKAAWFMFALLSALGFYTIPIMLYPFGIVVMWLCLSIIYQKKQVNRTLFIRGLISTVICTIIVTFLLYVPVFIVSGFESIGVNRFVVSKSWSYYVAQFFPYLTSVWKHWNKDIPIGISLLCVVGVIIGLLFRKRMTFFRVPLVLAAVLWCLPLLTLQRVMPPDRVWLFLLPLYFGCASVGMSCCIHHITSKIACPVRYKSALCLLVPVVLSLWLSYNCIQRRSVYYSRETGTLRDAEQITLFMKGYLKTGDKIVAVCPSDSPLNYYFTEYDVPVSYLSSDFDTTTLRIVAVVNHLENQSLEGIIDKVGLSKSDLSIPKVLQRYESATLYEIYRDT
jgi:4-amino-4-deoxy-L-arabinose transferase-like glycosyltransferase